jgi:hypothetical protein
VRTVAENLTPTAIRFRDRPARSKSLYRPKIKWQCNACIHEQTRPAFFGIASVLVSALRMKVLSAFSHFTRLRGQHSCHVLVARELIGPALSSRLSSHMCSGYIIFICPLSFVKKKVPKPSRCVCCIPFQLYSKSTMLLKSRDPHTFQISCDT